MSYSQSRSNPGRSVGMMILPTTLLLILVFGSTTSAQDGGQVDGALWKFQMKPVNSRLNLQPRAGQFRVNGLKLYQKSRPDSPSMDKVIGRKQIITDKKTRLIIEDMKSNGGKFVGIKGTVVVEFNRFGEWSGRMIDSEGRHWIFTCSRIQE